MKQEPVAWMARNQLNNKYVPISCEEKEKVLPHVLELYDNWIPLYTEPQYRELSDEEMNRVISKWMSESTNYLDLCKAILKKASEK